MTPGDYASVEDGPMVQLRQRATRFPVLCAGIPIPPIPVVVRFSRP
jgi:hypothetical protein